MAPAGELRCEILLSDPIPWNTEELVPDGTCRMFSPLSTIAVISGNRAPRANLTSAFRLGPREPVHPCLYAV